MGNKDNWETIYGPVNYNYMGDFIGFTWDGMSMSRLNVVRTSAGDRYNENILPTMQDKTTPIPGADGSYYFNSFYTQKPFIINFAFDKLSEKGLRQLKQLFGDKGIHRLSFDEQPYKEYMVKVTGQPQLKYIPFDDETADAQTSLTRDQLYGYNPNYANNPVISTTTNESGETVIVEDYDTTESTSGTTITATQISRIYKGEGTLTLTAFCPYAKSRAKTLADLEALDEDVYMDYSYQWAPASGILNVLGEYDTLLANNQIKLYNPGDKEADFILSLKDSLNITEPIVLTLYKIPKATVTDSTFMSELVFTISEGELAGEDTSIQVNSKVELIEGIDQNGDITGNIYNNGIGYGWFFKIPQTDVDNYNYIIQINNGNLVLTSANTTIEYSYWYF